MSILGSAKNFLKKFKKKPSYKTFDILPTEKKN